MAPLFALPARERVSQSCAIAIGQVVHLIRRPDVLLLAALSAVNLYADYAVTFGFMPILAGQLGASDPVKAALPSLNLAAVAAGSLSVALLVRRAGTRLLLTGSVDLLSGRVLVVAVARDLPTLFLSQVLFGLAAGADILCSWG